MLQVSTGKFFETTAPESLYETVSRGVLYTNYLFLDDRISTCFGDILSATRYDDFQTVIIELIERLPKPDRPIMAGDIISGAGDQTMIQDFAAIVSFSINIICSPNRELIHRLTSTERLTLGAHGLPRDYVSRVFDRQIYYQQSDIDNLVSFISDLQGLKRDTYSSVLRSIHRYVTAMHRIADDINLAYTLLVASIEALAQKFDQFEPQWSDLEAKKRNLFDISLDDAPDSIRDKVRAAILKVEHTALKKRFHEFTNKHLRSDFFRSEMHEHAGQAGRTDIRTTLKNAYDIRSKYVHTLAPIPQNLVKIPSLSDIQFDNEKPFLTLNGMARIARYVILEVVKNSPKVEKENYNYQEAIPGLIPNIPLATKYWLPNANNYNKGNFHNYLNGFLLEVASFLADRSQRVSDMRPVMKKIRHLFPSSKQAEAKQMLALYVLSSLCMPEDESKEHKDFLETKCVSLFKEPTIEGLITQFLINMSKGEDAPDWDLEKSDELLKFYIEQRYHKNGINAGPLLGAGLTLWIAEMFRKAGDEKRARELVSYSIEEFPSQKAIIAFEESLNDGRMPEIDCIKILLPHLKA